MNLAIQVKKRALALASSVALLGAANSALALNIITPGDPIVAIDLDVTTGSDSPAAEVVEFLLDNDSGTKYLNFGITDTGFIVTPDASPVAAQSFRLTTANDAEARDPASWVLYGTNDPITTMQHGNGRDEDWTQIGMGELTLPEARQALGDPVGFANATPYMSYKMVFPTIKDAAATDSMQVADVQLFESMDASGTNLLNTGDTAVAIRDVDPMPSSNSPEMEGPEFAIDLDVGTKYLNFGALRSGFIVTPSIGQSEVTNFQITTANDFPERDPTSWELYGTNDEIVTENNGIGDAEDWTLIDSGMVELPEERDTQGPEVAVNNTSGAFSSYRMIFPALRNEASNSMQIAEIALSAEDPATLVVDRSTGEAEIRADETMTFAGYNITSQVTQGLNDENWTSVASTDADLGDTWEETSPPGSTDILSESDTEGGDDDGLTLTAGSTYSLGNVWEILPSEFEDLFFDLRGVDGERIADGVEYVGSEIVLGDYSGNGSVGPEDWPAFRSGYGGDYTGATRSEAYLGGDLDGDFDSDLNDFNLFVAAAGGAGALFGTVPEPSSLMLLLGTSLAGLGLFRRQVVRGAALIFVPVGLLALSATDPAQAQSFTNVGQVPAAITIPADQMNENEDSGPENFFDDDFLDDPGEINDELFILDYNDPDLMGDFVQYAGLGPEPKTVFFDYGSSVSANWFAYSQRSGGDPTADRVGTFEFWFSDTSFNDEVPVDDPDAVVKILPTDSRLRDSAMRPYPLGGSQSGRYVAMRLTVSDLSANQPTNNIGGHEFRLLSGPDEVVLEVDQETGDLTINNNLGGAAAWDLTSYTIESPSGALDPDGFDGIGGASGAFPEGDGSGNGWEVGEGSNFGRLADAYFSGASTLASGTTDLSLGDGYNVQTAATDLVFTFSNADGEVYNGRVEYVGTPVDFFVGDYNDDGTVNAADYVVWRNSLGTDADLPGDPTPGSVDQFDYVRWAENFGNIAGGGSGAAPLPEPATLTMVLATLWGVPGLRRRRWL